VSLVLRQPPVLSVSSVSENGTAVSASGYTLRADLGLLQRGAATSPSTWAFGTVDVTYVAGYANPPQVAVQAVLETLRHLWDTQQQTMRPSFGGESLGETYAPGATYALPRRAAELLAPLRVAAIG
jgi:hypothetical protein